MNIIIFNSVEYHILVIVVLKYMFVVIKHYRIPKGQSKMDNPEKLAT